MKYYVLKFTYENKFMKDGKTAGKRMEYSRIEEASDIDAAKKIAEKIVFENRSVNCEYIGCSEVVGGKVWKVEMDGIAHHDVYDREDMHKVMFVDALSPYDAEQVAFRRWEREVKEDGFRDISIYRTLVVPPKVGQR